MRPYSITFLVLALTACSQVAPSPEALTGNIAVLDTAAAARCQLLDKAELSAPTGTGVLERVPADVEQDLRNLAINQAAGAGADGVAPLTPMAKGKQTYGLYKCQATGAKPTPTAQPTPAPSITTVKTLPYTPPT